MTRPGPAEDPVNCIRVGESEQQLNAKGPGCLKKTGAYLGGDPITEDGGVGLLPALCRRLMACMRFMLLDRSGLGPSSPAEAAREHPPQWPVRGLS